jgi:ribonuclease J
VDFDEAMALPRREVMIIATGGQGEPRAALARIALGQHKLALDAGDLVIFSSKQIPGNEIAIGRIQNELAAKRIEMITDRQAPVHVSGHPGRPELAAMYDWIRPEIIVPVHGELRHMFEQAHFARARGIPHGIVQKNGDLIRLAPNGPEKLGEERVGRLVLDGDVILPADGTTMNERRRAATSGLISVAVALDDAGRLRGGAELDLQGIPVEEDRDSFLDEACRAAADAAAKNGGNEDKLREAVRLAVRRCATEWTGKKPVVSVLVLRV